MTDSKKANYSFVRLPKKPYTYCKNKTHAEKSLEPLNGKPLSCVLPPNTETCEPYPARKVHRHIKPTHYPVPVIYFSKPVYYRNSKKKGYKNNGNLMLSRIHIEKYTI